VFPTITSQNVDILAISSGFGGRPSVALGMVRELRSAHPKTRTVLLLDSNDAELVIDAFRAGARGVFSRESSLDLFCKCIRSVDRGEIWADNRGIALAVDALASSPVIRTLDSSGLNLLSKRESEVVQCVVQGMSNREIGERLGLSQHTVKNYLFRVYDKLGVSSRVELLFMSLGRNSDVSESKRPQVFTEILRQSFKGGANDKTTVALVEQAAQQGMPAAQFFLAQSLAQLSDPEGSAEAYMWFVIAAEQARQARAQLATKLTPKQIEEAHGKALKWIELAKPLASSMSSLGADVAALQIASVVQEAAKTIRPNDASRKAEPESPSLAPTDHALTYGSA
jgi:DNA-binding NarL/FixJ family response regulator